MGMKRMFWRSRSVTTQDGENGSPASIRSKHPRRRLILTLALSGAVGGFLVSHLFAPNYTSQSVVLVKGQQVPANYVMPVITSDFTQRVQALSQEVLSAKSLHRMIDGLPGLVTKPEDEAKLISDIQQNMQVEPVITSMSAAASQLSGDKKDSSLTDEPVPGFTVNYTDSNAERSQKICNALTSLIVTENLKERGDIAKSNTELLKRLVDDARTDLEAKGAELIAISKDRSPRSPEAEAKYKVLALDYDNAKAIYQDLLAKKSSAEQSANMEYQQMGEQMQILATAGFPEAPDFPNRLLFAVGGLGAGVSLGIGRLLWPAARKLFQRLALLFPFDNEIE
jgi:uncharacterized protein involved in exopolysaccharide biosynthesis